MRDLLPHSLVHVDFLSIDVEDNVMQVLRTIPWERMSVDVVLAECRGALEKRCIRLLQQHGYLILPWIRLGGDILAVREACAT